MNRLPNGVYRTKAGSTVAIRGPRSERCNLDLDVLEEGICPECDVDSIPLQSNEGKWFLFWDCDECGGGSAEVFPESQIDLEDAIAREEGR